MRYACSLCESLDHYTYQCPMIIEYKQRQVTLIQTLASPTESMINLTPSLEILHIISPEPKALPIPPWLLDDLYKDLPPILPFISPQKFYAQLPLLIHSISIFGLCQVNHHNLIASFPLLLHHQRTTTW
jgi:hypothetical protein